MSPGNDRSRPGGGGLDVEMLAGERDTDSVRLARREAERRHEAQRDRQVLRRERRSLPRHFGGYGYPSPDDLAVRVAGARAAWLHLAEHGLLGEEVQRELHRIATGTAA